MPPKQLVELTGVYDRQLWRPTQTAEERRESPNNFVIGLLSFGDGKDRKQVVIKGNADPSDMIAGNQYRLLGKWFRDDRRIDSQTGEPQQGFQFEQYTRMQPLTRTALTQYLQKHAPHVGPRIAARLYDRYGQDAVAMLRESPRQVAAVIDGLTVENAIEASVTLKKLVEFEETKIALTGLFAGRGFPATLYDKVIKIWGIRAPAVIEKNPFRLLSRKLPGCGFARVDRMYIEFGGDPGKIRRQLFCVHNAMLKDGGGHTWFSAETLRAALSKQVSTPQLDLRRVLRLGTKSKWLATFTDAAGKLWIASRENADAERRIAESIKRLRSASGRWPTTGCIAGTSQHQREQLRLATTSTVGVLAGTPGTGKTFATMRLAKLLADCYGADAVAVVAPTGKAAVRCTENLAAVGLEIKGTTAHRFLGVQRNGHDGNGWGFKHNSSNPADISYLLVDESSIFGAPLMADLLEAIPTGAHVLLIGDPYQLPPVDHGAPFRDIIASGDSIGMLQEVRRNSGDIITACAAIKDRKRFVASSTIDPVNGRNFAHIETQTASQTLAMLQRIVSSPPDGIDPVWDVQPLVAVNEKSPLGKQELNQFLQRLLNPSGKRAKDNNEFAIGDKVIVTSNTFLPKLDLEDEYIQKQINEWLEDDNANKTPSLPQSLADDSELVCNGEIGQVLHVWPGAMIVAIRSPQRVVMARWYAGKSDDDEDAKASNGDKPKKRTTPIPFELAYAITTHKAQGSSAKIIVPVIDEYPGALMTTCNEWWYTALSRAELMVITLGRWETLMKQCRRSALWDRKTFLKEIVSGPTTTGITLPDEQPPALETQPAADSPSPTPPASPTPPTPPTPPASPATDSPEFEMDFSDDDIKRANTRSSRQPKQLDVAFL